MVLTVTSLLEVDGCPPIKLREERDNEDVPLRTGCRVWSCARLLAEWLANRSGGGEDDGAGPIVVGRDVLELGAGTGAVGLTCAALGASSVTMTDRDEAALALMHTNARINGHYDASSTCEVCVQGLDWGDPATYIQGASYDLVGNVAEWVWDSYGTYPQDPRDWLYAEIPGAPRVVRSCGYDDPPWECRLENRRPLAADASEPWVGFRRVRTEVGP